MTDLQLTLGDVQTNAFGDQYYPEINQQLFAKQSAEGLFKTHFEAFNNEEEMLYIIVGSDSGLLYDYVKTHEFPKYVRFLVIELDSVIQTLEMKVDLGREGDESKARLTNEHFEFQWLFSFYEEYVIRRKVQLVRSMSVQDAAVGTVYHRLWDQINNRYLEFQNMITVTHKAKQFDNARLYNAADNQIPLIDYRGAIEGATALILGGGPTLDDAIDWIKSQQDKLVIFSAARIARRLIKEGIPPDFFVSVDPHNVSFDNSKGIYAFEDQAILLHSFHVNQKLLGQWRGLTAYGGTKYGWKNEKYEKNVGVPGPNVINTAVSFAMELGCHNIIFSGVDFCFAHGKGHESGSDEAKLSSHLGFKDVMKVEANSGEMTPTQIRYASGREAMEAQVTMYKRAKPMVKFYSTGWASAKIAGVDYIAPADIDFLSEKTQDQLYAMKTAFDLSKDAHLEKVKETIDELTAAQKRFKKMHALAGEGLTAITKLVDPRTHQPKPKALEKVKKLRKKLDRNVGEDGEWLFNYNASNFADTFKPAGTAMSAETAELIENLSGFFKGLHAASEEILDIIDKGQERADLRMKELKGAKPFDLFPYWKRWGEMGRARYWRKWNDADALDEDNRLLLEEAERQFQEELDVTLTKQFQRMKKQALDLTTLLNKAETALESRAYSDLESMVTHAANFETQQDQDDFSHAIQGGMQELQQELEPALHHYLQVNNRQMRHFSLKRALKIYLSLEQYPQAMTVLEEMCTFSLDYMVPYADMVAVLGQKAQAAEILGMYLSQNPDKLAPRLKQAQYLMESQHFENARHVLQELLQLDPGNKAAQTLLNQLS